MTFTFDIIRTVEMVDNGQTTLAAAACDLMLAAQASDVSKSVALASFNAALVECRNGLNANCVEICAKLRAYFL